MSHWSQNLRAVPGDGEHWHPVLTVCRACMHPHSTHTAHGPNVVGGGFVPKSEAKAASSSWSLSGVMGGTLALLIALDKIGRL